MAQPGSLSKASRPAPNAKERVSVWEAFLKLFFPAPHEGESSLSFQRRESLQLVLLTVLLVGLVLTIVTWAVGYRETFYTTLVLAGVAAMSLVLNMSGRRRWAAGLLSMGILLLIEINSFFGEGIHDIAMLALPSAIVIAGMLYGRQAVPWFTILSVLTLVISPLLPYRNQLYGQHLEDSIIGSILLVGIGVLVFFTTRRLEEYIEHVQRSEAKLVETYEATLEGWARALELRDRNTEDHSRLVTEMTVRLARQLGIQDRTVLTNMRYGALLHDIGKIGIPDQILHKHGPLTAEEWQVMKQHPVIAGRIFEQIPHLKEANEIVQFHHERWDGSGYPRGLCGEQIPLAARVFAVIDTWQALGADRPYRPAWPHEEVMDFLKQSAGTLFDPAIVRTFLDMMEGQNADI